MNHFSNNNMDLAIDMAKLAFTKNEVPVGSVIVDYHDNKIISFAHNECEASNDPTAHAEILAIRRACSLLSTSKLTRCDLYVTLEPCAMCAAAISFARIRRLYFGAYDPKSGGVEHGVKLFNSNSIHHKPEIYGGIRENETAILLKEFFKNKREKYLS